MDNDAMHGGRVILSQTIRRAARRMDGVISVDVDESFETVAIDWRDSDGVFMQGDDAAQFIAEASRHYEHAQYVSIDDCYAALGEQYYENLA